MSNKGTHDRSYLKRTFAVLIGLLLILGTFAWFDTWSVRAEANQDPMADWVVDKEANPQHFTEDDLGIMHRYLVDAEGKASVNCEVKFSREASYTDPSWVSVTLTKLPDGSGIIDASKNRTSERFIWSGTYPTSFKVNDALKVVGDATKMFWNFGSYGLDLDLTKLEMSGVTNADQMFMQCNASSIELGSSMDNITTANNMFYMDRNLQTITLPTSMTVSGNAGNNLNSMFDECTSLTQINNLDKLKITGLGANNQLDVSSMFGQCDKLTSIDLSGLEIPTNCGFQLTSDTFGSGASLQTMILPANFPLNSSKYVLNMLPSAPIWWSTHDQKYYTTTELKSVRKARTALPADTLTTDLSHGSAADSDLTVEAQDVEYTGANATPVATLKLGDTAISTDQYTVSSANKDVTNGATASVTITGKGNPYYGSFTKANAFSITKKTPTADDFTFAAPADLAYSGSKKAATLSPTNGQSFGAITYHYRNSDNEEVNPIQVGTYSVKIDVAEGNNNAAVTNLSKPEWTFTIEKADPVVTAPTAKELTYTGKDQALTDAGSTNGGTLMYGTDATDLSGYTSKPVERKNAGTYDVYYYVKGDSNFNSTEPVKIPNTAISTKDIGASDITAQVASGENLTYTGDAITPKTTITYGDTTLAAGEEGASDKDYYLTYADNINAKQKTGKESVITVHGMGNYVGERTINFTIKPKSISWVEVEMDAIEPQTYTGSEITPEVKLYDLHLTDRDGQKHYLDDITKETEGNKADYTVTYRNNINVSAKSVNKIVIRGGGNYTGIRDYYDSFEITKATPVASDFTFTAPTDLIYSGTGKEATFTTAKTGMGEITPNYYQKIVTEATEDEPEKTEYKPMNSVPVDAGTYVVKLNVADGSNYCAATELSDDSWTFTIAPKDISDVEPPQTTDITASINVGQDYTYTGYEICPIVTVKDGAKTMEMATDEQHLKDYSVAYSKNINAYAKTGEESVITIAGNGNYKGTRILTFRIERKSIDDRSVVVTDISDEDYTGEEIKPDTIVTDSSRTTGEGATEDGTVLVRKTASTTDYDYSVTYKNNIYVADNGKNKVTIKGEGNYTGSRETTFKVNKIDPVEADFSFIAPEDLVYTGGRKEAGFTTSKTGMGKATPVYYQKVLTKDEETGEEVTEKQKLDAAPTEVGTYIVKANVKEGGNYLAATELENESWTFTITPKNIGSEDIAVTGLKDKTYDGEVQTQSLTVEDKSRDVELTEDKDYTITYENNVNAGTATVNINGIGNYKGTAPITFTIEPRSIADATIHLGKLLIANGEEQTQEIESVTVEGAKDTLDVTYDVDGNKATDPGKHELTITGKGNYKEELTHSWVIVPTTDEEVEQLDWNIKIKTDVGPNAPLVKVNTGIAAMLAAAATADDMSRVSEGEELDFTLKARDLNGTIDPAVRAAIEQVANGKVKGAKIGTFFDLQLLKQLAEDEEATAVTNTNGKLSITLKIPESLINTNKTIKRTYFVVRDHDNKATVLDSKYDANAQTLTIESDGFSEYAIAYKDEAIPQKKAPKTSDENQLALWLGMMLTAVAGLGGSMTYRRKH